MAEAEKSNHERAGLCAHCQWMRLITSDRGSVFYLCGRAAGDPRFAKYPRLPVRECIGYQAVTSERA
jgi:hypothetical protein